MLEADALALQADLMARNDAPEDAEPKLARALSIDPGHLGAQIARVRQRLAQEQVREALDLLGQGALAGSERLDVQLMRAEALREAERFAESVAVYRQLVTLRPSSPFVHYGMSLSLMGAGDPEAIAAFTRCLSLRQSGSWFRSRQRNALRLGLDGYVASDAINWVRRNGWPDDEGASYVMLAKAFTELRQKKAADAAATLTEIAAHHKPGDWMLTLVAFFRGELTGDALVARAGDDGQRTEAHAYAGIKAHIEGDDGRPAPSGLGADVGPSRVHRVRLRGGRAAPPGAGWEHAMTRRLRAATRVATVLVAVALGALAVEAGPDVQAQGRAQSPAAAAPAAPAMSRDWKRLRTPSLTVVGNAGAGELRRVATEIERFRLALGAFAPAMRLDSPLPTTVVVFSDDRAFMPFKPRQRGRPMPFVAGYFSPLPEEHRIVMSGTGQREFTFYVIFHEYTHLLVNQNVRRLPLWLHEGLAEFYSTFSGSEQDGRTIIGRPIEWRVATLASSTPLPLARLTSPAALGELLRDPVATARFYATAWALTHYLMVGEGGGLRPKLLAFVKACESGQDAGVAFKSVFGEDLAPLDKRVEAHVMKLQLSAIQLPTTTVDLPLATEPMLETDAQQIRADLLVRQGAHDEAAPYLARALQVDPQHVGARLTKARSLLAQERAADALDLVSAPESRRVATVRRRAAPRRCVPRDGALRRRRVRLPARNPNPAEAPAASYGLSLAQMALDNRTAAAAFTRCLTLRRAPSGIWRAAPCARIGVDTYVVSDAYNYVRLQGWQTDASSYAMIAAALTQRG